METLARAANRGSVSTGYDIDNSLKLEADNTEYLSQTIGAGSRTTATYSFWFKRTELGVDMQLAGISPIGSETTRFLITSGDVLDVESGVGGDNNSLVTNRVFRDTSAWYHFVVAIDTTQSTASNRVKVYVNGVQETSFSFSEYPAQNTNLTIGVSGYTWRYGAYDSTYNKSSGYLAEAYYIDAQQLDPTSFGEFDEDTGIWKPIAYTGSFGSNGHYLDFKNAADLGNNSSGVGNDFTLNNITSADQATDTPTNNFCTINAVNLSTQILTEGATKIVSTDNTSRTSFGTMAVSKGKWWWEGKIQVYESDDTYPCIGVTGDLDNLPATSAQLWGTNHVIKLAKAQKWVSNATGTLYGTAYADNDIINIALDMDNHIMYTYKNGTIDNASGINFSSQSAATAGNFYIPINLVYITGGGSSWEMNFGGYANYTITSAASDANGYGTFEYAPPSGYYALCSKNLAEFG